MRDKGRAPRLHFLRECLAADRAGFEIKLCSRLRAFRSRNLYDTDRRRLLRFINEQHECHPPRREEIFTAQCANDAPNGMEQGRLLAIDADASVPEPCLPPDREATLQGIQAQAELPAPEAGTPTCDGGAPPSPRDDRCEYGLEMRAIFVGVVDNVDVAAELGNYSAHVPSGRENGGVARAHEFT